MTTIQRFTPDYKMHAVRFEAFAREAEHGEYVRFDAHQQEVIALKAERDAQQKRADALAVENVALKSKAAKLVHEASEVYSAYNATIKEPDGDFMDMQTLYEMQRIETPSTDAVLAAIRNEATARALKNLCDCQLISATVAELKAAELREAK